MRVRRVAADNPDMRTSLVSELEAALAAGRPGLLVLVDADDLREHNRLHGLAAGDAALAAIAGRLSAAGAAPVHRHVGDCFGFLATGAPEAVVRAVAAWLDALSAPDLLPCSFGAAHLIADGPGAGAVLTAAERRLTDQQGRGPLADERILEVLDPLVAAAWPAAHRRAARVAQLAPVVAGRLGLRAAERERIRRCATLGGDARLAGLHAHLDGVATLATTRATLRALDDALAGRAAPHRDDLAVQAIAAATGGAPAGAVGRRVAAALDAQLVAQDLPARLTPAAGPQTAAAAAGDPEAQRLDALARLHALLDTAGHIDDPGDLGHSLQAVAQAISETLGFRNVVINLHRPEWDDYIVATVFGAEEVRDSLLGATYDWAMWEQVLDERFAHRGTYLVYAGQYDWSEQAGRRYVPDLDALDDPRAWQAEDEVFVVFHQSDGALGGILNVGAPVSGLRPSDAQLDTLVVVARHAARAVERAQMAALALAHRRGLERLLAISTDLTRAPAADSVLEAVVDGVADALGFQTVSVHLADEHAGGALALAARSDRDGPHPPPALPATAADLARLLTADVEREGCFLLTREQARSRVPALGAVPPGRLNGRGPRAWHHHWLLVPLAGHDGEPIGVILADDPLDRLLPPTEKLQALRLFANQAANALDAIGRREQLRVLAERDPLTLLLNRRALMADLDAAVARGRLDGRPLALAYCDLDGFKRLNDRHGHGAGDDLLRTFAEILTASIRPEDRAYRVGGDEFALLLAGCDDAEARRVVDRVLAELAARQHAGREPVGASFGVAVAREAADLDVTRLLHHADSAMYAEKRAAGAERPAA
jgi:diguanylate cyclase (GGDEF)-like protein